MPFKRTLNYQQKIQGLTSEATATRQREEGLQKQLRDVQNRNKEMLQKIQSMTGEVEAAKQTEGYLRTQLRDVQDSYQQKIQGLTSEATATRQREEGLQKQLRDVQNRSKRNKNPGNLEGQQDEMQVDQRHQLQYLEQQNYQMLQKIKSMTGEVEAAKQTEGHLRKQLHDVQNRTTETKPEKMGFGRDDRRTKFLEPHQRFGQNRRDLQRKIEELTADLNKMRKREDGLRQQLAIEKNRTIDAKPEEMVFGRDDRRTKSLEPHQRSRSKRNTDPRYLEGQTDQLQDEQPPHLLQNLGDKVKNLEQQNEDMLQKMETAKQTEGHLRTQLHGYQQKIQGLTSEATATRQREEGLQKQLRDVQNRTIDAKPEEMVFGRDDRRTKSLEPHQRSRSKRNTDPRYLEGQTDQLQDEQPPHLLQNLGDKVKNLEQQNEDMLQKMETAKQTEGHLRTQLHGYQQKIQGLTSEATATRQREEGLQKQLRDVQNSYQQKIQGLTSEATSARQREEGLQKQLHDVQISYQQKIQGLNSEATATRQREEGLQKQLRDVQNRTIKTEPEEAGFRKDDRRTKSLGSHQRSKRNKNPGNLEGQQDEMQVDQLHQLQYLEQQNYQMLQKIQSLTGEVEAAKQTERHLRKQLHDVQNRTTETKPEKMGFGRDDRRTKFLEPHQRNDEMLQKIQSMTGKVEAATQTEGHLQKQLRDVQDSYQQKIQGLTSEATATRQREEGLQKQLRDVQNRVNQLSAQLEREKEDKDDALRRIRHGNIYIPDLSDQNRPTKLGEVLSELYDNDWTDCFDELEGDDSTEAETIHTLLTILQDIYDMCVRWSNDNFFENVQCAIDRTFVDQDAGNVIVELPEDMKQPIKEVKKSRGLKVVSSIHKLVRSKLPQYFTGQFNSNVFRAYIEKCTEFSWLAAVHDPPLFLNYAERGDKFNTSKFREYMKRGPYVEYVVWPALHIKEGGPLLMKGVAQGAKEKPV